MTKSCRRAILLQYFGKLIEEDSTCQSLEGALCDNCQEVAVCVPTPGEDDFRTISDAINELPNHGIAKVRGSQHPVLLQFQNELGNCT